MRQFCDATINLARFLCLLTMAMLSTGALECHAEQPPFTPVPFSYYSDGDPSDPLGLFSPEFRKDIDESFDEVDTRLQNTVNSVDTFFFDDRLDEFYRGNRLRVRFNTLREEREGIDFEPRFRLHARLPEISSRLNLIVGSFDPDNPNQDQPLTEDTDNEFFAGVRGFFSKDSAFRNAGGFVDVGARFSGASVSLVSRLRFRYTSPIGRHAFLRLTPLVFLRSDEGLGSGFGMDIDRIFSVDYLLRNRLNIVYSEETIKEDQDVRFTNELSLFFVPTDERGFKLSGLIEAQTKGPNTITDYELQLLLRQSIYKNRIYIEMGPGIAWRSRRDYEHSLFLRFNLEFIFGRQGGQLVKNIRDSNRGFLEGVGSTDASF